MTTIGIIVLGLIYIAIDIGEKLDRKSREADGWI